MRIFSTTQNHFGDIDQHELAVLRPFDRRVPETVVDSSPTLTCSIHDAIPSYVVATDDVRSTWVADRCHLSTRPRRYVTMCYGHDIGHFVFSAEVRFCKCRYNVCHFFGYIDDDDDDDDDADDVSYLMDKNFIFLFLKAMSWFLRSG